LPNPKVLLHHLKETQAQVAGIYGKVLEAPLPLPDGRGSG
jgi:hypothetical protein